MKKLCLALAGSVFFLSACTTVVYDGPSRPDKETATLKSEGTLVVSIDGKTVPYSGGSFASFKVLPGPHVVEVELNDVLRHRISHKPLQARFNAEAGKVYVTRGIYVGSQWRPEIAEVP